MTPTQFARQQAILDCLAEAHGNLAAAGRVLGLSRERIRQIRNRAIDQEVQRPHWGSASMRLVGVLTRAGATSLDDVTRGRLDLVGVWGYGRRTRAELRRVIEAAEERRRDETGMETPTTTDAGTREL